MTGSLEVSGAVELVRTALSIPFDELEGIRVAADQVSLIDGMLRFRLVISWAVSRDLVNSFPQPNWALVAVARDLRNGAVAAVSLRDPTLNYLVMPDPNFEDRRGPVPLQGFAGGHLNAPLAMQIGDAPSHPGLLVHVAVLGELSNVIAVEPP